MEQDRTVAIAVSEQHPKLWKAHVSACEREKLVQVIKGQHEESMLPDNGWLDIFCVGCERSETFFGPVEQFAEELIKLRWAVDSVERSTAVCCACANQPDTSTYASQYEDNRGLLD